MDRTASQPARFPRQLGVSPEAAAPSSQCRECDGTKVRFYPDSGTGIERCRNCAGTGRIPSPSAPASLHLVAALSFYEATLASVEAERERFRAALREIAAVGDVLSVTLACTALGIDMPCRECSQLDGDHLEHCPIALEDARQAAAEDSR